MTTHVAVFIPGDERDGARLYWASDRKISWGESKVDRLFEHAPKAMSGEHLWVAGAGLHRAVLPMTKLARSLSDVWGFAEAALVASKEQGWPREGESNGDQRPEFLVCDRSGLWFVDSDQDPAKVKACYPMPIGSGRRYALGALYALMPQPTARADWAEIVRRSVVVAGECDEGTEGVECGIWRPVSVALEVEDVAVPA